MPAAPTELAAPLVAAPISTAPVNTVALHSDNAAPVHHPVSSFRRVLRSARAWIARYRHLDTAYRVLVAVAGGILTIGGLILVPLPGPGWLVVFLGLAVLGTEFHWAHRAAETIKRMLERFWTWWRARRARKASSAR